MTPERKIRPNSRVLKTPKKQETCQPSIRERSSSEFSSEDLVIDLSENTNATKSSISEKQNLAKNKPKRVLRKKRRKVSAPDEERDECDQNFEETIEKSAAKNNLSPESVKRLLKKLVMNDHVLAIVKLKEEDDLKKKEVEQNTQADGGDDEEEKEDKEPRPKLTRLKAKELNQQLFSLAPINASVTGEDVAKLIQEDLNSDDDDEEYKPGEEDIPSDDDLNTTIMEIDHINTNFAAKDADCDESRYGRDGIFKIPKPRNDSICSQSEQEQENIALRTRSKLCLTTTDIQTLESTFIPPDITTDMYECDVEMDQAWKDFLEEFTKPLPQAGEDDDDNDPEYVAADLVPFDPEEMRSLKVSKKELNELVSELIEMSNIDVASLEQALNETLDETLSCTHIDRSDMLSTPVLESNMQGSSSSVAIKSSLEPSHTPYNTTIAQTPAPFALVKPLPVIMEAHQSETGPALKIDLLCSPSNQLIAMKPASATSAPSVVTRCASYVENNVQNWEWSSLQKSTFVPTSDLQDRFFIRYWTPDDTMPDPSHPNDTVKSRETAQKQYRFHTTEVPVKVSLSDAAIGFTDFQLQLLQQQLRMHVQLTAQHYIQTFAHPLFWKEAAPLKSMLTELEELSKTNPSMLPWNLPMAIECCQSWEDEVSLENEQNVSFIEFLDKEIAAAERCQRIRRKQYQGDFHWRIKEKIINCRAFMYPSLLPPKTFRLGPLKKRNYDKISECEERLLAFWFERADNALKDQKRKTPKRHELCKYIVKNIWPHYNVQQLLKYVYQKQNNLHSSPVSFFLARGYSPPFKQVLECYDLNNIIPFASYQRGLLPPSWDSYIFSSERQNAYIQSHKATKCKSVSKYDAKNETEKVRGNPGEFSRKAKECTKDMNNDGDGNLYVSFPVKNATEAIECSSNHHQLKQCLAHSLPDDKVHRSEWIPTDGNENYAIQECTEPSPGHSVSVLPRSENVGIRSVKRLAASATLYSALKRYLKDWQEECKLKLSAIKLLNPCHPIVTVYMHLMQIEVYTRFLDGLRKMSENLASYRHRYSAPKSFHIRRVAGLVALLWFEKVDGYLIVHSRYVTHRFSYIYSMEDKDALFAFNYYEKVQETLLASGRSDLLEAFEKILTEFNEIEKSAPELYYQIEDLLGENFPELVDMFLTFLLPGQSAEVGRFFEHFILTNMSDFLEKLNIFFAKQPSQIKKVHACLNELSNEQNVTMEQVKSKVLPLLKGSTLLTEWFLQLFPCERPPESPLCDYEHVTLKKPAHVEYCDPGVVYEQVPYVETAPETTDASVPPNAIRYIQGRIFQGAIPARLTFLANNCLAKNESAEGVNGNQMEYNLCSEATLKAHAIRLNPLVHCRKGVTYADVAPLLTGEGNVELAVGSSGESPNENMNTEETKGGSSPKKVPPKLPIKKRFNSPTSRKLNFSPNEDSSPSTPGKESKKTQNMPLIIASDSKALSTSKKLKTLIETAPTSPQTDVPQEVPVTNPLVNLSKHTEDSTSPEPTNDSGTQNEHSEEQRPEPPDQPSSAPSAPSWTREEDEIILLKLIKGYSSVETFVEQIEKQLPERSSEQIRSRVEFLNEMLRRVNKK